MNNEFLKIIAQMPLSYPRGTRLSLFSNPNLSQTGHTQSFIILF